MCRLCYQHDIDDSFSFEIEKRKESGEFVGAGTIGEARPSGVQSKAVNLNTTADGRKRSSC